MPPLGVRQVTSLPRRVSGLDCNGPRVHQRHPEFVTWHHVQWALGQSPYGFDAIYGQHPVDLQAGLQDAKCRSSISRTSIGHRGDRHDMMIDEVAERGVRAGLLVGGSARDMSRAGDTPGPSE
jgi:hypothetical protein